MRNHRWSADSDVCARCGATRREVNTNVVTFACPGSAPKAQEQRARHQRKVAERNNRVHEALRHHGQ